MADLRRKMVKAVGDATASEQIENWRFRTDEAAANVRLQPERVEQFARLDAVGVRNLVLVETAFRRLCVSEGPRIDGSPPPARRAERLMW
jgi:hypothetical protein